MTKYLESRVFWGALLILGGVLFLLQNLFGYRLGGLFWMVVFGLGGLFFISVFLANRENWWALIPGLTLLGIGLAVGMTTIAPAIGGIFGGVFVLGSIGLSFLIIYLVKRDFWWAMIPAGVLLSLAIIVGLESFISDFEFVSLFFVGMGLTFAIVAMLPSPDGKQRWAWIPAGILLLIGVVFGAFTGALLGYVWPVALIVVGLILIYRTLTSR